MDDATAAKQAAVVERLKAREAQRVAEAARRQEEASASGARESAPAFLQEFGQRRAALDLELRSCASRPADDLAASLSALDASLAAAAYYLPPYDLRQSTLAVADLRERLNAAVQAQQPRKKFSFSKRPASSSSSAPPIAAAPTGPPPPQAQQQQQHHPSSGRTIRGLRGQRITISTDAVGGSEDVTLADLEGCSVRLVGPLGALFISNLRNCTVEAGPVGGAAHAEGLLRCKIYLASRQVRIHSAESCDFYLRVRSGPIIEHSQGLRFAPYACPAAATRAQLAAQGLEADGGEWAAVQDFGWLRATASPHWSVLPEGERQQAGSSSDKI